MSTGKSKVFESDGDLTPPNDGNIYASETVRVTIRSIENSAWERRPTETKIVHVLSGTLTLNGKPVHSTATILPGTWHRFAGPAEILEVVHYSK
jgi:quercetin dioxygenase-like cupin family protein